MNPEHQLPLSCVLRWSEPELLGAAKGSPDLAFHLLTAPKQRLQFVAFVLAMTPPPVSPRFIYEAATSPMREVLTRLGFGKLKGVRRALGRIHRPVLDQLCYRQIAELLSNPTTAALLHHAEEITPELLDNLGTLPLPLCNDVIVDAIGHIPDAARHVVAWTEIAASKLPGKSIQDVQEAIGDSASFVDLKARLTRLQDGFPALEGPPSKVIGHATRIDAPSAIRQLGKQFENCLSGFVDVETDGYSHLYHWKDQHAEAICEVSRFGNLGFFLGSHLGPGNKSLDKEIASAITDEFRSAGIRELKIVETYDDLYYAVGRRNRDGVNDNGQYTARNRPRHLP